MPFPGPGQLNISSHECYVSIVDLGWHQEALQDIHAIHTADNDSHVLVDIVSWMAAVARARSTLINILQGTGTWYGHGPVLAVIPE